MRSAACACRRREKRNERTDPRLGPSAADLPLGSRRELRGRVPDRRQRAPAGPPRALWRHVRRSDRLPPRVGLRRDTERALRSATIRSGRHRTIPASAGRRSRRASRRTRADRRGDDSGAARARDRGRGFGLGGPCRFRRGVAGGDPRGRSGSAARTRGPARARGGRNEPRAAGEPDARSRDGPQDRSTHRGNPERTALRGDSPARSLAAFWLPALSAREDRAAGRAGHRIEATQHASHDHGD